MADPIASQEHQFENFGVHLRVLWPGDPSKDHSEHRHHPVEGVSVERKPLSVCDQPLDVAPLAHASVFAAAHLDGRQICRCDARSPPRSRERTIPIPGCDIQHRMLNANTHRVD